MSYVEGYTATYECRSCKHQSKIQVQYHPMQNEQWGDQKTFVDCPKCGNLETEIERVSL